MKFTIKVIDNPAFLPLVGGQYLPFLTVPTKDLPPGEIDRVWGFSDDDSGSSYFSMSKYGTYYESWTVAVNSVVRKARKEVKRLTEKGDLKPSQVRRLELLREFVENGSHDVDVDFIEMKKVV